MTNATIASPAINQAIQRLLFKIFSDSAYKPGSHLSCRTARVQLYQLCSQCLTSVELVDHTSDICPRFAIRGNPVVSINRRRASIVGSQRQGDVVVVTQQQGIQ